MDDLRTALRDTLRGWRIPMVATGVLVAIFLLLPVLIILPTSVSAGDFVAFPPDGFSLRWYEVVLTDPAWVGAILQSVRVAVGAGVLATVAATAAALAVHRMNIGERWFRTLFVAPLVIPYVVYALGLFLVADAVRAVGSSWTVIAGQAALAFPLVFLAVAAGLGAVDPAVVRAASSLGARWPTIVVRVELPLIWRSIMGGALFALAFSFDEVVVALFLSSPLNVTLPVHAWNVVIQQVTPAVAAVSSLVMAFAVVLFGLGTYFMRPSARRVTATSTPEQP
jgi:putative spermidine/putrescine transport system permease protein